VFADFMGLSLAHYRPLQLARSSTFNTWHFDTALAC
jgi:hypothetical protein